MSRLTAVQLPLIRGWRLEGVKLKAVAGVFTWAQMGYNLTTSGWPRRHSTLVSLLVCLAMTGLGLRRVRLASLQAERRDHS